MKRDEGKLRAWQARGARRYAERQREAAPRPQQRKRKPSDAPWREEAFALRGAFCRRCRRTWGLECDHLKPRSQGGASVIENALCLCSDCHRLKTEHRILVERSWLDADQIVWLAREGWVEWDADGEPRGRGCRSFAPVQKA